MQVKCAIYVQAYAINNICKNLLLMIRSSLWFTCKVWLTGFCLSSALIVVLESSGNNSLSTVINAWLFYIIAELLSFFPAYILFLWCLVMLRWYKQTEVKIKLILSSIVVLSTISLYLLVLGWHVFPEQIIWAISIASTIIAGIYFYFLNNQAFRGRGLVKKVISKM